MSYAYECLGENVGFEEKHIMEKNGFEVPGESGVRGMGSVGKFLRNFRELSEKFPENRRVVR